MTREPLQWPPKETVDFHLKIYFLIGATKHVNILAW
jgi:hypothetical protein